MSPSNMLLVFLAIVLGIHDQHIHIAQKLDDPQVLALGLFLDCGVATCGGREWLIVGEKSDGTRRSKQAVTYTDARMVGPASLDTNFADTETQFFKLLNAHVGRHLRQTDRKARAFHLAGQDSV